MGRLAWEYVSIEEEGAETRAEAETGGVLALFWELA